MKTSPRGIKDIIHSEGLMLKAYKDSVGVWTIGVGHAATSGRAPIPKAGMTITRQEAESILADDLAFFEKIVNRELPNVPQHVYDGAVSFVLNTGGYQKNGKPASWFALYRAGKLVEAEQSFLQWRFPPEIFGRRKREADLIFRGKYYSPPVTGSGLTDTPVINVGASGTPNYKSTEKPTQTTPIPDWPVPEAPVSKPWYVSLFEMLFKR